MIFNLKCYALFENKSVTLIIIWDLGISKKNCYQ